MVTSCDNTSQPIIYTTEQKIETSKKNNEDKLAIIRPFIHLTFSTNVEKTQTHQLHVIDDLNTTHITWMHILHQNLHFRIMKHVFFFFF